MKNASIYVAVSPMTLLAVTVVCYFAITLLYRVTGRRHLQHTICTVEVWQGDRKVTFLAKIDTGNSLTEPFSGLPVAVVERAVVAQILPETLDHDAAVRMVPYHTVSGEGLLPAFRPERCRIRCGTTVIETTGFYLGVSDHRLHNGWQGLLHPAILSTGTDCPRNDNQSESNSEANT